jgi:hypothetical protein
MVVFTQAANAVGYGSSTYDQLLKDALVPKGKVDYFVELHIEQVCQIAFFLTEAFILDLNVNDQHHDLILT